MNQRTRKLMTMHNKASHPRDNMDKLYVSRKGKRRLASIEDSADTSIRRLEDYIYIYIKEKLITATKNNTNKNKQNSNN